MGIIDKVCQFFVHTKAAYPLNGLGVNIEVGQTWMSIDDSGNPFNKRSFGARIIDISDGWVLYHMVDGRGEDFYGSHDSVEISSFKHIYTKLKG